MAWNLFQIKGSGLLTLWNIYVQPGITLLDCNYKGYFAQLNRFMLCTNMTERLTELSIYVLVYEKSVYIRSQQIVRLRQMVIRIFFWTFK